MGFAINYFNPEGIPLVREKLELKWASDSLLLNIDKDSLATTVDSSSMPNPGDIKDQNPDVEQSKENTSEEIKPPPSEPEKKNEEVVAFTEPKAITLEQAYVLFNKGLVFIDARDEADYLAGHIANSINIPFDDFENHKLKLDKLSKEEPLVIYCAGTDCDLSILLGNKLFELGYNQVFVFFGGWLDWINANYPIENLP